MWQAIEIICFSISSNTSSSNLSLNLILQGLPLTETISIWHDVEKILGRHAHQWVFLLSCKVPCIYINEINCPLHSPLPVYPATWESRDYKSITIPAFFGFQTCILNSTFYGWKPEKLTRKKSLPWLPWEKSTTARAPEVVFVPQNKPWSSTYPTSLLGNNSFAELDPCHNKRSHSS